MESYRWTTREVSHSLPIALCFSKKVSVTLSQSGSPGSSLLLLVWGSPREGTHFFSNTESRALPCRCDSAQASSLSPERPLLPSTAHFSGIFPPQVFLDLPTLHMPPQCHETTSGKQLCHHSNIRSHLLGGALARCCSKSFTCTNMFSPHNTLMRHVLSPSP